MELLQSEINDMVELKKELAKLKEENNVLKERFSTMLKSNLKDQSYLDSYLIDSYQSQIVNYEMQKSKMIDELNNFKSKLENSLSEMFVLKNENETLKNQNQNQNELIQAIKNECDLLKEYRTLYEDNAKENQEMKNKLNAKHVLDRELVESISKNENTIRELRSQLRSKDYKINELEEILEENRLRQSENARILTEERKNVEQLKIQNQNLQVFRMMFYIQLSHTLQ